jgi:hypothetical protein
MSATIQALRAIPELQTALSEFATQSLYYMLFSMLAVYQITGP